MSRKRRAERGSRVTGGPASPGEHHAPTGSAGGCRDRRGAGRAAAPSRALLFAGLCAVVVLLGGGYIALAAQRAQSAAARSVGASGPVDVAALRALSAQPHLLFLSTAVGDTYGKVSLAPLGAPDAPRVSTGLECERVYYAAGQGLCLGNNTVGGFLSSYSAYTFDDSYAPRATFQQPGIPSRVRVSPDGRYGTMTVFVTGHSYAESGFSTRTTLVDLRDGMLLGDLEQFAVTRDGTRFQSPDFNFWGVTFTRDGGRFYATLATGGKHYLVEGDVVGREMRVIAENVECPSLSPDNRRVAFKRQVGSGGRPHWQIVVRDLASGEERTLAAETRSVDDQIEWLDDAHVLYALGEGGPARTSATSIWVLPIDGSAPPSVFLAQAYSPAVVR